MIGRIMAPGYRDWLFTGFELKEEFVCRAVKRENVKKYLLTREKKDCAEIDTKRRTHKRQQF